MSHRKPFAGMKDLMKLDKLVRRPVKRRSKPFASLQSELNKTRSVEEAGAAPRSSVGPTKGRRKRRSAEGLLKCAELAKAQQGKGRNVDWGVILAAGYVSYPKGYKLSAKKRLLRNSVYAILKKQRSIQHGK